MDIFDVRPMTNTVKDANESHEMTIAPVSWEKITRSRIGLRPEQLDGGRSDDAALCSRLRRREVDGVLFFKQPFTLQTQGFKPTKPGEQRSEEHTSELQSLMRISYAVFCLKQKTK